MSIYTPTARPAPESNSARRVYIRGMLTSRRLRRSANGSATHRPSVKRGSISYTDPPGKRSSKPCVPSCGWPCERGLPVVLHCVKAFEPLMRELAECEPRAVIFHGFIGSPEQARRGAGQGILSLVRRTDLRIAQNSRRTARNAPVAAVSRDRRQSRVNRGDLRPGSRSEGHSGGGAATGDAG